MANLLFQEFIDPFQKGPFLIRAEYYTRYSFAMKILMKQIKNGSVVYDLGCGNGYGFRIITENRMDMPQDASFRYIGFDNSPELLTEAREKYTGGTWVHHDLDTTSLMDGVERHTVPLPGIVIAFEILEHLEDPEKMLNEIFSLLPFGGKLILSVPNAQYEPKKKGKPKNKFHKHLFTPEAIAEMVKKSGFQTIQLYGQPYTNRLYHYPKAIGYTLDTLTNTIPLSFRVLARSVGVVKKNTHSISYSTILLAVK